MELINFDLLEIKIKLVSDDPTYEEVLVAIEPFLNY